MRLAACTAFAHGDIQEDGILAQLQGGSALFVRDAVRCWQKPYPWRTLAPTRCTCISAVVDELVAVVVQTVLGVDLFAGLVLGSCCVALDQPRHDTTSCLIVRGQWSGARATKALEKTPFRSCAQSAV